MGARTECRKAAGCATLDLRALVHTNTGGHTISFQVLRQSPGAMRYLAQGSVRVSRDGILLPRAEIPLHATRARLRTGESVDFDIRFEN